MIRKGLAFPGAAVPRKSPTVIGRPGGLPSKRFSPVSTGPVVPRKASGKSWSPKSDDAAVGRMPMRHVEATPVRQFKDYWESGAEIGDMIVAADNLAEIVPDRTTARPVHPYLGADYNYGYAQQAGATSQPVPQSSVGIYAGTVRVVERAKTGNVSVLRHTAIFASGRYILTDLNLFHPHGRGGL